MLYRYNSFRNNKAIYIVHYYSVNFICWKLDNKQFNQKVRNYIFKYYLNIRVMMKIYFITIYF